MNSPSSNPQQDALVEPAGRVAGQPTGNHANWDDEDPLPRRLSATEAEAHRDQRTAPSPWRVVLVQAELGCVIALVLGLLWQSMPAFWAALFGVAVAVVPGLLMARGATRLANSKSPLLTATALLGWESVKIVSSVAMLVLGLRVLRLPGPPMLIALAGCLAVYWAALAWRSR